MLKLIIFGTGDYFTEKKEYFNEDIDVIAFLDNDTEKHGKKIDNIEIVSPDKVINLEYDYICLMSMYHLEMREQLLSYGVSNDKIVLYYDAGRFMISNHHKVEYEAFCQKTYDVLFLSWGLDYSGSNIALYEITKILKENNYTMGIISAKKGDLYHDYQNLGIDVVVEPYISVANVRLSKIFDNAKLIFVNTACFAYMIDKLCNYRSGSVLWWLHESEQLGCYKFNKGIYIEKHSNLYIYSVSTLATKAFIKAHGTNNAVGNLLLGLPDRGVESLNTNKSEKLVFAIIGILSWIKGQDLFIDAFQKLRAEERKQIEVWFIGVDEGSFADKIKQAIQNISHIKCKGEKAHEELLSMYKDIDVVVSTSRCETVSIVIAEGMMNKKGVLVSSAVGIADYIKDKENGLIFETENTDALVKKIRWILNNKDQLSKMGERARETYEKYFTINVFEKNCKKIIQNLIK